MSAVAAYLPGRSPDTSQAAPISLRGLRRKDRADRVGPWNGGARLPTRQESTMTVNPNGPLRDDEMETVGTAGQATGAQDADGLDSADADGTDTTDADGTDTTDTTDADGTDTSDADGTDTTDADGTDTTDADGTDTTDADGRDA